MRFINTLFTVTFLTLSINSVNSDVNFYNINIGEDKIVEYSKQELDDRHMEVLVWNTLQTLFQNKNDNPTLIPKNVKINNMLLINGELEVELSKEILNYGGSMWEQGLIDEILTTIFCIDEIKQVTLTIEDRSVFVEGSEINGYTRNEWNERKVNIWQE